MNDDVVKLDDRRKGSDRSAPSWMKDKRVIRIANPHVRVTVAYLLDELEVNPITLEVGSSGYAIFTFEHELIEQYGLTRPAYIDAVQDKMFNITYRHPEFLVLRGAKHDKKGSMASIIYIL